MRVWFFTPIFDQREPVTFSTRLRNHAQSLLSPLSLFEAHVISRSNSEWKCELRNRSESYLCTASKVALYCFTFGLVLFLALTINVIWRWDSTFIDHSQHSQDTFIILKKHDFTEEEMNNAIPAETPFGFESSRVKT